MSTHVAVIVGSLRKGSFSRSVALELRALAAPRLDLEIIEIGDLPLYNEDLETDTPPEAWQRFRKAVSGTQAVLFVTPEYNRSLPAVLKNAIDVGSRPYGHSVWNEKPAAIVSVSPGTLGGFGANHHLRQSLVFLNMPLMQQPEAYLSKIADALDENGRVTDERTRDFLKTVADKFANWIDRTRLK
ncbi:NADPH-dependent FMN reductase [Xanthobacter sp. TB0136]|uniref:NADPH-dependent FMN reductase n=1 Tax=Xanthobacter sp. TB0136 TaxID=3459177 RepID=UPI0040395092